MPSRRTARCTCCLSRHGIVALPARFYFSSSRGLVALAVRENELRVEYLGGSVRGLIAVDFIIAAFLADWAAH